MSRCSAYVRLLIVAVLCSSGAALAQAKPSDGSSLGSAEGRAAAKIVTDYYRARDRFDLKRAEALEADDMTLVNLSGEEHKAHKQLLKGFMDYEKYMHGRWHSRILSVRDGMIDAEIIEENDYYRYLGSGRAVLQQRYTVANGQIHRIQVLSQRYDGEHQDTTHERFVDWIKEAHPERVDAVLPNGHLVFDGNGAREQLPLMKEFANRKKPK